MIKKCGKIFFMKITVSPQFCIKNGPFRGKKSFKKVRISIDKPLKVCYNILVNEGKSPEKAFDKYITERKGVTDECPQVHSAGD